MNSTVNGAGYTCVTVHGCTNKKIGVVCALVRVLGYACVLSAIRKMLWFVCVELQLVVRKLQVCGVVVLHAALLLGRVLLLGSRHGFRH